MGRCSYLALLAKNLPASVADIKSGFDPRLENPLEREHGNPLSYFCLENPLIESLVGYSPRGSKSQMQSGTEHMLLLRMFGCVEAARCLKCALAPSQSHHPHPIHFLSVHRMFYTGNYFSWQSAALTSSLMWGRVGNTHE